MIFMKRKNLEFLLQAHFQMVITRKEELFFLLNENPIEKNHKGYNFLTLSFYGFRRWVYNKREDSSNYINLNKNKKEMKRGV